MREARTIDPVTKLCGMCNLKVKHGKIVFSWLSGKVFSMTVVPMATKMMKVMHWKLIKVTTLPNLVKINNLTNSQHPDKNYLTRFLDVLSL